ncbi:MAG: hypothetical protein FWH57_05305 [Oscillospiraceae bacterium]|nr:hypothetical protein [Oscillospiraceae bacterium]
MLGFARARRRASRGTIREGGAETMLFERNITPSCAYCHFGTDMGYGVVACVRRGIMAGYGSCRTFRYEPTKRVPEVTPDLNLAGLSEEDFSL